MLGANSGRLHFGVRGQRGRKKSFGSKRSEGFQEGKETKKKKRKKKTTDLSFRHGRPASLRPCASSCSLFVRAPRRRPRAGGAPLRGRARGPARPCAASGSGRAASFRG